MVRHLLVTNDFPPKIGGIQNYLWELWRRLDADEFVVYTPRHREAEPFDAAQPFRVVRSRAPWFVPQPQLVRSVNRLAQDCGAELVIIDPAIPAGLIGPHLNVPYGVVLHGAEVTVPARLFGLRQLLNRVLDGAVGVIAGGAYALHQGEQSLGRALPASVVLPGVDTARFAPLDSQARQSARATLGLPNSGPLLVSVSRLVPRKGMDTLIRASIKIRETHPDLCVAIAGTGRDSLRLKSLTSRLNAPVRFMGRLNEDDLSLLYGCGDLFAMLCRNRWGGLEQEGFGIVFVEAAASGVAQVAGRSGGAHEAVVAGETGLVVGDPNDVANAARIISELLSDDARRNKMALAGRVRVEEEFSYDVLATKLVATIEKMAQC